MLTYFLFFFCSIDNASQIVALHRKNYAYICNLHYFNTRQTEIYHYIVRLFKCLLHECGPCKSAVWDFNDEKFVGADDKHDETPSKCSRLGIHSVVRLVVFNFYKLSRLLCTYRKPRQFFSHSQPQGFASREPSSLRRVVTQVGTQYHSSSLNS